MDASLYVAVAGSTQALQSQVIHANNLAHARTTAFRADLDILSHSSSESDKSRVYVKSDKSYISELEGSIEHTGRDLDIAVEGKGYLAVLNPQGEEVYTRNGNLQIAADGSLYTGDNLVVLGNNGPIKIPPHSSIQLGQDGTVAYIPLGASSTRSIVLERIKMVQSENPMIKGTDGLLRESEGEVLEASPDVKIRVGALESSNVNAIHELTQMLEVARNYEVQMKMMSSIEEKEQQMAQILQV